MKKILLILAVFTFTASYAQDKEAVVKETVVKEITFKVEGVCDMCKKRIEAAALRTKGVKLAEWNKKTKDLKVIYNSKKIDLESIQASVSDIGHDTPTAKADSSNYAKLPNCCRYRDGAKCEH